MSTFSLLQRNLPRYLPHIFGFPAFPSNHGSRVAAVCVERACLSFERVGALGRRSHEPLSPPLAPRPLPAVAPPQLTAAYPVRLPSSAKPSQTRVDAQRCVARSTERCDGHSRDSHAHICRDSPTDRAPVSMRDAQSACNRCRHTRSACNRTRAAPPLAIAACVRPFRLDGC